MHVLGEQVTDDWQHKNKILSDIKHKSLAWGEKHLYSFHVIDILLPLT